MFAAITRKFLLKLLRGLRAKVLKYMELLTVPITITTPLPASKSTNGN